MFFTQTISFFLFFFFASLKCSFGKPKWFLYGITKVVFSQPVENPSKRLMSWLIPADL